MPFITQTAIGIREYLRVYGDDYNTPDGSAIRDYINVVDLARAHVIAIRRLLDKKQKIPYEVFNLGTGRVFPYLKLSEAFESVTGQKLKYRVVERREGDVEKVYADTAFANKELGWKAEKGIEETLLSAWKWENISVIKKQLNYDNPADHRRCRIYRIPRGKEDGAVIIPITRCINLDHLHMQVIWKI